MAVAGVVVVGVMVAAEGGRFAAGGWMNLVKEGRKPE